MFIIAVIIIFSMSGKKHFDTRIIAITLLIGVMAIIPLAFFKKSSQTRIKPSSKVKLASNTTLPALISHGTTKGKLVALTFDADMTYEMQARQKNGEVDRWYDPRIINILMETQTPATIFMTGLWIETYPREAASLAFNPLFELGNHSYSHPAFHEPCYSLSPVTEENKKEQIQLTQDLLYKLTGERNKLFRFPGGCYSDEDLKLAVSAGLSVVQWDVVSQDAFAKDAKAIVDRVTSQVKPGSIVVMHLGGPNAPVTAAALPLIIDTLHSKGYTFVTVSHIVE